MSTLVTGYNGNAGNTSFLKGAADRVLDKSTHISLAGEFHELTAGERAEIKNEMEKMASQGLRVLGLAFNPAGGQMKDVTKENKEQVLEDPENYDRFESE